MTFSDNNILAKTRAEEHDADVWGDFYIPPYFNRLGLKAATKSSYIVGRRGCGKTMLLKYLDYHTSFSIKRPSIDPAEISHIGIYWRVDTQFCNSLNHRGISEYEWISIFESYFSLVISIEIIRAIGAIAKSSYPGFGEEDFSSIQLNSAKDFHPSYPTDPVALERHLESTRRFFSSWISNISRMERPILPPGKIFLEGLIEDIKKIKPLNLANFYVYVDEVENLVSYQRKVLNSLLKHSQRPLIVSFTSKELSNETATTGNESINATHDFRLLELDSLYGDGEKKIFFSEVFLANLDLAKGNNTSELLKILRSPDELSMRSQGGYGDSIITRMKSLFPSNTLKEISTTALQTQSILNLLEERINKALSLHKVKFDAKAFTSTTTTPDALIILPALLNRVQNNPEHLLKHLQAYANNKKNDFVDKGWIHNNLFGALLELYRPYGRICPIYSGFDTFFVMANNNLRHFLILCYKALEFAELNDETSEGISTETQARAAYEAADQLIREIKTFGAQGERLRMFVLRLGNVFRALQATPQMSEPEQNQFSLNSGHRVLSDHETDFISEAKKYGIITEQLETKTKGPIGSDIVDYQLNPIYSPYFQISYRRKRKIDMSVEDFHIIALGTEDEFKRASGRFVKHQEKQKIQSDLWEA